jgi:hypothetical protein
VLIEASTLLESLKTGDRIFQKVVLEPTSRLIARLCFHDRILII